MSGFRQAVFYAMIPMNIALILWVWIGRGLFGVTLMWIAAFMLFTFVPLALLMLTTSTALAFAQRRRPVRLTTAQAWAQVALWGILLVTGAVVIDVDDATREESIVMLLTGWSPTMLDVSMKLTGALALAAVLCWAVLVALLLAGRRKP